jgi:hypothetical protein
MASDNEHAQYCTLSHCWGRSNHTMALSHENLNSMIASIKDSEMPRMFREAIILT